MRTGVGLVLRAPEAAAPAPGTPAPGATRRSSPPPSTRRPSAPVRRLTVGDEDRVVAESTGARRRGRQPAGPAALDRLLGAIRMHERDHRHELCRTVRVGHIGELIEQQLEIRRGVLLVPGPVRREDPRRSAQHVDGHAGVVGQRRQTRVRRRRSRLDQCVRGEGDAVFDRLRTVVADHLEVGTHLGDDRLKLLDLVRVVRGQNDARHVSPRASRAGCRAARRSRSRPARAAGRARACRTAHPRPCPAPRRTAPDR